MNLVVHFEMEIDTSSAYEQRKCDLQTTIHHSKEYFHQQLLGIGQQPMMRVQVNKVVANQTVGKLWSYHLH